MAPEGSPAAAHGVLASKTHVFVRRRSRARLSLAKGAVNLPMVNPMSPMNLKRKNDTVRGIAVLFANTEQDTVSEDELWEGIASFRSVPPGR